MVESFKASAQYGDWEGTAAADGAEPTSFDDFLESKGITTENDFVLGVRLSVFEYFGPTMGTVIVTAYVYEGLNDHDSIKEVLEDMTGPIPVREIKVDMTLEEFFQRFKRFSVMLTASDLNLEGREYRVTAESTI